MVVTQVTYVVDEAVSVRPRVVVRVVTLTVDVDAAVVTVRVEV